MKKDPNYLIKLEKAIKEKYGNDSIINPKSLWDDNKEKEYLKQIKDNDNITKRVSGSIETIIENNGFLIDSKLIKIDDKRVCPKCEKYSLLGKDDLYLTKFGKCYVCFLKYDEMFFGRKK